MPQESKPSFSVEDLNQRLETAQTRCMTLNHILRQVSYAAHECLTQSRVPDTLTKLRTLLRLCIGGDGVKTLPMHEVAAELAALEGRHSRSAVKKGVERFLYRADENELAESPKYKRAVIYTEQRLVERSTGSANNVTFDPIYRDAGRLQFEGKGVADLEKQRLASQIDLLRTVFHVLSATLSDTRGEIIEKPKNETQLMDGLETVRHRLGHVGYLNGSRKEHRFSLPFVIGCLYNHLCQNARALGQPEPRLEDILRAYNSFRLGEIGTTHGDADMEAALEAAKIMADKAWDYPVMSKEKEPPLYDPEK